MSPRKVAVVYSLPSVRLLGTKYLATDEDSSLIAEKVALGLKERNYEVSLYPIGENEIQNIAKIKADCVFNLIEWCGLDIALSQKAFKYLRELNVPVTGSNEELFVLTGDKIRMKMELQKNGISTPKAMAFVTGQEQISDDLPYPMIVKPSLEHCSVGLEYDSIAHDPTELRKIAQRQIEAFSQPAMGEEFIEGREFLVYLLQDRDRIRTLPIEEVMFPGGNSKAFQTYATKWEENDLQYKNTSVELASLTPNQQRVVENMCIDAFKKMGLSGYSRFDIRYRGERPHILETNANPSVYDSDKEDQDINGEVIWGIKFPDYLQTIVETAVYLYEQGWRV